MAATEKQKPTTEKQEIKESSIATMLYMNQHRNHVIPNLVACAHCSLVSSFKYSHFKI